MRTPPPKARRQMPEDPLDAPSLQPVRNTEGLVQPESRLKQYVHNEPVPTEAVPWGTADEAGIVRDAPFGQTPFGGETPFFTGGGVSNPAFQNEPPGIPMGMPDLLDLKPVPEPSAETSEPIPELPTRVSDNPTNEPNAKQGFLLGLVVASVAWALMIVAWILVTFR